MKDHFKRVLKLKTLNLFNEDWYEETVGDLLSSSDNLLSSPSFSVGGYVYFVKPKRGDNVKVGFSSDIISRLRSFKTVFDSPIILIGYIYSDDYKNIEKELHSFFEKKRISGEWFNISRIEINEVLKKYDGRYVNSEFLKSSFIDKDYFGGFRSLDDVKKIIIDIEFKKLPKGGFRFYNYEIREILGINNSSLRAIIKAIKHNCAINNCNLKIGNSNGKRWLEITEITDVIELGKIAKTKQMGAEFPSRNVIS